MRVTDQSTLAGSVAAAGVGLHAGVEARITLRPATAGAGIIFRRMDVDADVADIPATPAHVTATHLGVRLSNAADISVMTVEHLMAAFALAGVDNALVEIDGPEIPIFDGSAARLLALIGEAGIRKLRAPRAALAISASVRVEDGDRFIELTPAAGRPVEVSIDYADAAIGRQRVAFSLDDGADVLARVAAARTFCSLKDVETMRAAGLSRGGSLDNALVVDGERVLNAAGLRDPQEFALHKALDLIGDLYLAGAPVYGRIRAHKPGHDMNTRLARKLAAQQSRAGDNADSEPARLRA